MKSPLSSFLPALLSSLVTVGIAQRATPAQASPPMIEFLPGSVSVGMEAGAGQCPCIRWIVQAQGIGGSIETRDFLISTEALLSYQRRQDPRVLTAVSEVWSLGGLEALLKGSRFGLRFDGIQFGHDLDRGTTDLFRTGLDLITQLVQQESVRLRLRTGVDFEHFQMNLIEDTGRVLLPQSLDFAWNAGIWSGNVQASFSFPADALTRPEEYVLSAAAQQSVRLASVQDLELALGASLGFTRDPFRMRWGISPHDFNAQLTMNVQWVGLSKPNLPYRDTPQVRRNGR